MLVKTLSSARGAARRSSATGVAKAHQNAMVTRPMTKRKSSPGGAGARIAFSRREPSSVADPKAHGVVTLPREAVPRIRCS